MSVRDFINLYLSFCCDMLNMVTVDIYHTLLTVVCLGMLYFLKCSKASEVSRKPKAASTKELFLFFRQKESLIISGWLESLKSHHSSGMSILFGHGIFLHFVYCLACGHFLKITFKISLFFFTIFVRFVSSFYK